jgi:hypothetical protein
MVAQLARDKVQRAVEIAQRHRTDMLVVTETGISETGEMLVREWITADNKVTPEFELTPHFASATADDGSPMRNRGVMVLLSPRMQSQLAQDSAPVPAPRGRGLSMRFQDGVHGYVRILAVYGTADHSKKAKAGENMTGAVERLAVAEWLRTQGEEARGKRLRPEKVLPMVDIEDTVAGGARADSGPEGEGSSAAAIVQVEQAEPLMVIGDLNCAPAPADRLSLVERMH